jgi:hypothetical protein
MIVKIILMSALLPFLSVGYNKCSNNTTESKITVVGKALVVKHNAYVLTDDSLRYYLDGIDDWDEQHLGKRIRVTGRLVIVEYKSEKSKHSEITAIPQQRVGVWKIIKKPKWILVG